MSKRLASLLLSAAIAPVVTAQESVPVEPAPVAAPAEVVEVSGHNQYISVLPGYFRADKSRDTTKHGLTGSLVYGYKFSPHWGMELNLMGSTLETGSGGGTDFYQQGGTIDAVYDVYDRSERWTPFVLAGLGAVENDVVPNSRDEVGFLLNAGLGVVSAPFTSIGIKLRAEGRYQYDNFEAGYSDLRFLAGIEIPFGGKQVQLAALPPPQIEIREVIKEVIVPAPFVDSDKDTVENSRDKCADTPEGLKVDAEGCVIVGQALELKGVTFAFNKAELQLNAQTVLDYVEKGMRGQPSMQVEIAGHTDSVGPDAANLKLSQKRAEAVRDYLVAKGIGAARLKAKGYGETQLLVKPDEDAISRERNRRVVFVVVGQ